MAALLDYQKAFNALGYTSNDGKALEYVSSWSKTNEAYKKFWEENISPGFVSGADSQQASKMDAALATALVNAGECELAKTFGETCPSSSATENNPEEILNTDTQESSEIKNEEPVEHSGEDNTETTQENTEVEKTQKSTEEKDSMAVTVSNIQTALNTLGYSATDQSWSGALGTAYKKFWKENISEPESSYASGSVAKGNRFNLAMGEALVKEGQCSLAQTFGATCPENTGWLSKVKEKISSVPGGKWIALGLGVLTVVGFFVWWFFLRNEKPKSNRSNAGKGNQNKSNGTSNGKGSQNKNTGNQKTEQEKAKEKAAVKRELRKIGVKKFTNDDSITKLKTLLRESKKKAPAKKK